MDSTNKQRDSIIAIYSKNMDFSSESQVFSPHEQFMVSTVNNTGASHDSAVTT